MLNRILFPAMPPRKRLPYKKTPKHPAMKPRSLQWCTPFEDGYFICGKCKKLYRSRKLLQHHKETKCYNWLWHEDQRMERLRKADKMPTKERVRRLWCLPKPQIGRPRLSHYPCKHCGKKLPDCNKRRDHQRRCKGYKILKASKPKQ